MVAGEAGACADVHGRAERTAGIVRRRRDIQFIDEAATLDASVGRATECAPACQREPRAYWHWPRGMPRQSTHWRVTSSPPWWQGSLVSPPALPGAYLTELDFQLIELVPDVLLMRINVPHQGLHGFMPTHHLSFLDVEASFEHTGQHLVS